MSTGVGVDIKISKSHIVFTSFCENMWHSVWPSYDSGSRLSSSVGAKVLSGLATVDNGTIKFQEKVEMSRELIIRDADDVNNPVTKNPQETDFTDYLNNKLTPKSIYHSVNKIKYNNKLL